MKNVIIELNEDPRKSTVKLEDGTIVGGVYNIEIYQEVDKPPTATIYLYPERVTTTILEENLKIIKYKNENK